MAACSLLWDGPFVFKGVQGELGSGYTPRWFLLLLSAGV